jgi:hypothetical protein
VNVAHSKSKLRPLRDLVLEARAAHGGRRRRRAWLTDWLNRIEEVALAPRAFTAVLRIEPAADLLDRVRVLADDRSLLGVPGVLGVRFSLREDALLFTCVHEGEREDVLYELFQSHAAALDPVLAHCSGYPGGALSDAWVRMFLDAAVERRVPAQRQLRSGYEPRLPMHAFERAIPDEAYWIGRCARLARAASRRKTREARRVDPTAVALRGVHAKHHGFIQATFNVSRTLPPELRHGVFEPGRSYAAWLRVSNMSKDIKPDRAPDARGLAIKLEDVRGAREQDFLLASHPVFIVKDVRDYTVFQSLIGSHGSALSAKLGTLLFFARRRRERRILKRALSLVPDHPLAIEYHSMSAYALGSFHAVKYLVRPLPPRPEGVAFGTDDDLRLSLQRSLDPLAGRALRLEFCLVVPSAGRALSVEDACADWSKHAEIVPVATIEIEPQDPCSRERLDRAEEAVFSLQHSLPEHEALGSLSRARKAVYRQSADCRIEANRG